MTEPKHYIFKAETGDFRITAGSSLMANTALIASESLTSPSESSVILPQPEKSAVGQPSRPPTRTRTTDTAFDPTKVPGAIVVPPIFKLVFVAVLAITALSGIAQIVMASLWEKPTNLQQEVFSAMGFAWKVGFGAIVGLLGGKVIK
jgi:hypothetical protein